MTWQRKVVDQAAISDHVHLRRVRFRRFSIHPMSFWVCKFQMRYPRLHRSFLELRSVVHRIRLLWRQGSIDLPRMGHEWYRDADHNLRVNMRTQGRIRDIQNLLARQSWASPEDCRLFLSGWDAGCEWAYYNRDIAVPK